MAVGRILGRDLLARIQRADGQEGGSSGTIRAGSRAGEVDVCALLDGAERLCAV